MRKKILNGLIFVGLFFVLNFVIGSFLETPKKILIKNKRFDSYWRWNEFYEQPNNSLDLIFLGSSHCYRSFDPKIFDAALDIKSFNMGSSDQTPLTSYYVLKEILASQKPKLVVFEIYWYMYAIDDQFSNATYNFEYMRSRANRMDFFVHAYKLEDMMTFVLPSLRYRFNLRDSLRNAIGKPVFFEPVDFYGGKGYVGNTTVVEEKILRNANQFKDYKFYQKKLLAKNIIYLKKIIDLCKQEGIGLVFVTSPLPPTSLAMIKNYASINAYFLHIARENGIEYIDYNVSESYSMFTNADFKDDDHLNTAGVDKVSHDLAQKLKLLD